MTQDEHSDNPSDLASANELDNSSDLASANEPDNPSDLASTDAVEDANNLAFRLRLEALYKNSEIYRLAGNANRLLNRLGLNNPAIQHALAIQRNHPALDQIKQTLQYIKPINFALHYHRVISWDNGEHRRTRFIKANTYPAMMLRDVPFLLYGDDSFGHTLGRAELREAVYSAFDKGGLMPHRLPAGLGREYFSFNDWSKEKQAETSVHLDAMEQAFINGYLVPEWGELCTVWRTTLSANLPQQLPKPPEQAPTPPTAPTPDGLPIPWLFVDCGKKWSDILFDAYKFYQDKYKVQPTRLGLWQCMAFDIAARYYITKDGDDLVVKGVGVLTLDGYYKAFKAHFPSLSRQM